MSNFIVADRKTDYLLPPSLDDWLAQDHVARFVVEVVDHHTAAPKAAIFSK